MLLPLIKRLTLAFALCLLAPLPAATVTPASVTLTWEDNSTDESGFVVERAVVGGQFFEVARLATDTTSFADTSAVMGVTYQYRVSAYNDVGSSGYSNTLQVTASDPVVGPVPAAPTTVVIKVR